MKTIEQRFEDMNETLDRLKIIEDEDKGGTIKATISRELGMKLMAEPYKTTHERMSQ